MLKFSVAEKSLLKIRDQVEKNHVTIIEALKNGNYKLIRYKANEMRALVKVLELDFIRNKIEDCLQLIQKHMFDIDASAKKAE